MQGTYLITGGDGFIGRNIKQYLQKNNCDALTLDTLSEFPYVADEDASTTLRILFLFAYSRILRVPLALTLKPPMGSSSNCGGDVVAARWNIPSNSSSISIREGKSVTEIM